MKERFTYLIVFATFLFTVQTVQGQSYRGSKKSYKKEYYKKQEKQRKAYLKAVKKEQKAIQKYKKEQKKAYKKFVKQQNKIYKKHPSWYGHAKFKNHKGYVYFPKYRAYYNPYNKKYVYRNENAWIHSSALPKILADVDLGSVQVRFISELPR